MFLQQPRIRPRQSVFRQHANCFKQRRAHFVIQDISTAILFARSSSSLRARRPRIRTHVSAEGFASACRLARAVCLASASLPRNGMLRRRTDSAAETSSGRIAVTCTRPFAATLPSSRSVCHRRNSRNSPDKRASAQIQGMARTASASTPTRCPPNHERRMRSPLPEKRPPGRDPIAENQNCHGARRALPRPMDKLRSPPSRVPYAAR